MMRTGADYLRSLADDREVYVDGQRVEDIATHPGFASIAATIGELYDLAADPANEMIYSAPETGRDANRVFSIPRDHHDLVERGNAIRRWAEHTHGWVGRSPDHVGAFMAGFAAHPQAFATDDRDLGENVLAYHRRLLDESLYLSYAIIPPQASRTSPSDGAPGELVQVGVVDERADGIVVRGAQMLATGAAVADEIFVSCIKPLGPDDADFAVSFVLPVATSGLKLYCRRPYASAASSAFDYPLASRYDESDALVVFDDVFVPWDRVFVSRDVAAIGRQFFTTGAHVAGNWQAQIRFSVKLQFLAGIAHTIAVANGVDRIPGVVDKLGELASLASMVESSVLAAEYTGSADDAGQWLPGKRAVYGAMGLQSEIYPRVLAIVRELAGGGVLQVPSSVEDLRASGPRHDFDRYVASAGMSAEDRIKLLKLAWDAVGSEFAGRHHQYEMFYAGAPFVARGYAMRNYGFDGPAGSVKNFLASYDADEH